MGSRLLNHLAHINILTKEAVTAMNLSLNQQTNHQIVQIDSITWSPSPTIAYQPFGHQLKQNHHNPMVANFSSDILTQL